MTADATQVLRELFPRLSTSALEVLAGAASFREVPPQVTLCHEGEVEESFYIIISGCVDVYKVLAGQRLLVNELRPGAHFGDIALLLDQPRSATIITAAPSQLLVIDRKTFAHFVATNPQIVVALSQMVIKRFLVQETKQLLEIARLKKRDTPPPKVFLSYARSDEAFVTRLANNLLKQHIDVWIDGYRIDPGKSWARQIGEALDQCGIMLLVLSPAGVASENVEDEWNYYLDQKKPVVSVLHQPCKVPYRLSKLQHVSFHETDYDDAVARVVATLNTML
jgi:CRP-like cAMP-binding protein